MQNRFAATKMLTNVLDVGRAKHSGREIETRDFDADAMVSPEQVGRRKNLDVVFVISPGTTSLCASRVSGCHGFRGFDRTGSSARCDAFNHPCVNSRDGRSVWISRSPSLAVRTETSSPTSLRLMIQLVSSWSMDANKLSTLGPAINKSCGSGSPRLRKYKRNA